MKYKDIFIPLGSSSANTGLSGSTKIISVTHTNKYSSTCVNLGLAPLNKFWYAVCDEPVEVGDACVRIAYV